MTSGPVTGVPWWVQAIATIGLPGAIALLFITYYLNLIPGVTSLAAQARADINRMELTLRENQSVMRWTCHAIWAHSGDEKLAKVCWQRFNDDRGRSDRDEN